MFKLIDWLWSPYVEYHEPKEMYHHEKIFFKSSIRTYCGVLTINQKDDTFWLKIFIGEPYFRDGTQKYLHEAHLIGQTEEWIELENAKQVIKTADKIIKEHEVKERTLSYFKINRNFIVLKNEKDSQPRKEQLSSKPKIFDYEEKAYANYIAYLESHPDELDEMDDKERKEIFKQHPSVRIKYHEWKALQVALKEMGEGDDD